MSNDFAAIVSATMAALLLLLIAEFQAGVRGNAAVKRSLDAEYAHAIQASFFEFWTERPLAPDDKNRVERDLKRYQELRRTAQSHVYWQYLFLVAGVALVWAMARVLAWAPHEEAHLAKGGSVAKFALAATAFGFLVLVVGFLSRFLSAYEFAQLKAGIELADRYGIPDVADAQRLHRRWEEEMPDGPSLRGRLSLLTAHIDTVRALRRQP
ncbi:hypothetical protein [Streptomyces sp. NPDC053431]|uniref:hypothetical protein n=1 Tax=Streptomyces sp. NPDC053431 TaxID=3365703 RepID=UPI0037D18B13